MKQVCVKADDSQTITAIYEFLHEACVEEEGNVMPMKPPGGSVNQMLLEC